MLHLQPACSTQRGEDGPTRGGAPEPTGLPPHVLAEPEQMAGGRDRRRGQEREQRLTQREQKQDGSGRDGEAEEDADQKGTSVS